MAKILHTADLHLGLKLSGLGKSGDKVRAAIKDSFAKMVDICLEQDIDAFVIAGDLFDSNNISKPLLEFALREISRLKNIPAILIPGTHDYLDENSVLGTLDESECPENLYLFSNPEECKFAFPELGLTFYANPNQSPKSEQSPLEDLKPDKSPGYHIAIAHGSLAIPGKFASDDWPIALEEIENSGFDYIALGHWHSYMRGPTQKVPAVYSGAPETISFKQKDAGFASLITFSEGNVEIEKVEIGQLEWSTIELPCTSFKYTLELEREISKHVDENQLLKVSLTGIFPSDGYIDFERLQENLEDKFLFLKIVDQSQSVPEDMEGLSLPETTILGQYIKLLTEQTNAAQKPEQKELLQDSLKLGYALLSGKDSI
jgi:DNA repair exonuclease SbcCD nuclease subunit